VQRRATFAPTTEAVPQTASGPRAEASEVPPAQIETRIVTAPAARVVVERAPSPVPERMFVAPVVSAGPRPEPERAPFRPLLPDRVAAPPPRAAIPPVAAPTAAPAEIRIEIGRIELRAEAPERRATPPRPAPQRPALMSLEDYLSRGRRR
jgi:hypothetical protein